MEELFLKIIDNLEKAPIIGGKLHITESKKQNSTIKKLVEFRTHSNRYGSSLIFWIRFSAPRSVYKISLLCNTPAPLSLFGEQDNLDEALKNFKYIEDNALIEISEPEIYLGSFNVRLRECNTSYEYASSILPLLFAK